MRLENFVLTVGYEHAWNINSVCEQQLLGIINHLSRIFININMQLQEASLLWSKLKISLKAIFFRQLRSN